MTVIAFPKTRNRPFICRHARRMAELRPQKGEDHLRRLLDQQVDVMRRRGIPEAVVVDEARAVEAAIRAELWRVVILEGGAA